MRSGMVGPFSVLPSSDLPKFQGRRPASQSAPRKCKPRPSPLPKSSLGAVGMACSKIGKFSDARWECAVDFLRRLHPVKTADAVAADTGIKADTVRKLLAGVAEPSFRHYSRLLFAYGPEFAACVYERAPAWLRAGVRDQRQRQLEEDLMATARQLADMRGDA